MNLELVRLEKERDVIMKKRNEASRAYIEAEHQRTEMRLKFERRQAETDAERQVSNEFKKQRRETTYRLGQQIVMLSTKARENDKLGMIALDSEVLQE